MLCLIFKMTCLEERELRENNRYAWYNTDKLFASRASLAPMCVCRKWHAIITDPQSGIMRYANPILKTPEDVGRFLTRGDLSRPSAQTFFHKVTLTADALYHLITPSEAQAEDMASIIEIIEQGQNFPTIEIVIGKKAYAILPSFKALEALPIKGVHVKKWAHLEDITALSAFKGLERLNLEECDKLSNLDVLANFPHLAYLQDTSHTARVYPENLDVTWIQTHNQDNVSIKGYNNLTRLNVYNAGYVFLNDCPNLTHVDVVECEAILLITDCPHIKTLKTCAVFV